MVSNPSLPTKHDPDLVERATLEEILLRRPERLTVAELRQKIVGDPEDAREIETFTAAIHGLRAGGLIHCRDDELVEPTRAVLRYVALVGSP